MTIAFPCENCGHRFEVDAGLAGRKGKCKKCGHIFMVPVPRQMPDGGPKSAVKTFGGGENPPPAKVRTSTTRSPTKPAPPADSFASDNDPYGLHEEAIHSRQAVPPEDDEEFLPRASLKPAAEKPRKKKKKSSDSIFDRFPLWVYLAPLGLLAFLFLGGLVNATLGQVFIGVMALITLALYLVSAIGTLVTPFRESVVCGLMYLFVPFYSLYYFISRWDAMKPWFLTALCAVGTGILTLLSIFFFDADKMAGPRGVAQAGLVAPPRFPNAVARPGRGNEVTLNVSGLIDNRHTQYFGNHLQALLQKLGYADGFQGRGVGASMTYAIPSADARAVADGITWAHVTRVDGQTIDVEMDPLPPEEAKPDGPMLGGPAPARPQETDSVDSILLDLKSAEQGRRRDALRRLANTPPDPARRVEVAAAIEPLTKDPDGFTRADAFKALGLWGGPQNTSALVEGLKDPAFNVRWAVFDAIAALKDPAFAGAVAPFLVNERGKAANALRAIGPPAEPDVIKYLKHNDVFVRMEACKILKEIGGSEEGKLALAELLRKTNGQGLDAMAANEALQKLGPPKTTPARRKSVVPGTKRR